MRNFVMCSSRGRPKQLMQMIVSFLITRIDSRLMVYIADDDEKIEEYREIVNIFSVIEPEDVKVVIGENKGTMVNVLNYLVSLYPNEEYYSDVNDDHVYQTVGWDKRFIEEIEKVGGWGLACGYDRVEKWEKYKRPSAVMVSGNIIRAIGYWMWPEFNRIGCDDFHKFLGEATNLIHLDNVIIEHRCWNVVKKREKDLNDRDAYDDKRYRSGVTTVKNYEKIQLPKDIIKINEAKNG